MGHKQFSVRVPKARDSVVKNKPADNSRELRHINKRKMGEGRHGACGWGRGGWGCRTEQQHIALGSMEQHVSIERTHGQKVRASVSTPASTLPPFLSRTPPFLPPPFPPPPHLSPSVQFFLSFLQVPEVVGVVRVPAGSQTMDAGQTLSVGSGLGKGEGGGSVCGGGGGGCAHPCHLLRGIFARPSIV